MIRRGKSLFVRGVGLWGRRYGGQAATALEMARERKEKLLSQFRPVPGLIESKWYINRREWLKLNSSANTPAPHSPSKNTCRGTTLCKAFS